MAICGIAEVDEANISDSIEWREKLRNDYFFF